MIFKWDECREDKLFRYIINVLACLVMKVISLLFKNFFREAAIKEKEVSKTSLASIKCPMLTTKSMIQIVDFYAKKCGAEKINDEYSWKLCNSFLQIIQDTGGLSRALQFILTICFNKLNDNGKAFFQNISGQDFDEIFRKLPS
jgi:hypothetical protein